ncbi:MAG: nitroreductase family protein [Candidatus Woesearchaeota archaeon]|nr:nitroreductase family protein [Candidatus Woesearchaeota archaeon]
MNNLLKLIKNRRSVRQYANKPIQKKILEEIIDAARLAPSAINMQPWEFVVITEKEMLNYIAENARYGKFIKDSAACVLVCGDKRNHHLVEDCSAATENILLAAKSFKIGSCWVAGYNKPYCKAIKTTLGIPEDIDIISIIPLGYYKKEVEPHGKRALEDVLHWEKY